MLTTVGRDGLGVNFPAACAPKWPAAGRLYVSLHQASTNCGGGLGSTASHTIDKRGGPFFFGRFFFLPGGVGLADIGGLSLLSFSMLLVLGLLLEVSMACSLFLHEKGTRQLGHNYT